MSWEKAIGYISIDRKTVGTLTNELPSVDRVFHVIVSQAICRKQVIWDREQEVAREWNAGTRCWSVRTLATACNLSINTVRKALKRLVKLELIKSVASKFGTIIQALNFFQYRRKNPNKEVPFEHGVTQRVDTRVSKPDHYRINSYKDNRFIPNSIAVSNPRMSLNDSVSREILEETLRSSMARALGL